MNREQALAEIRSIVERFPVEQRASVWDAIARECLGQIVECAHQRELATIDRCFSAARVIEEVEQAKETVNG